MHGLCTRGNGEGNASVPGAVVGYVAFQHVGGGVEGEAGEGERIAAEWCLIAINCICGYLEIRAASVLGLV